MPAVMASCRYQCHVFGNRKCLATGGKRIACTTPVCFRDTISHCSEEKYFLRLFRCSHYTGTLNKLRKGVIQHLFPQMCHTYHYTIHLPPEIIIVMRIAASTHCKHVPVYVALQQPQWQHC